MPLTLSCFCEDDPNISVCALVELKFVIDVVNSTTLCNFVLGNTPVGNLTYTDGHSESILGDYDDWAAAWGGLTFFLEANRSLLLLGVPESCGATWYFEAHWECYRNAELVAEWSEFYNNAGFDDCETTIDGLFRSFGGMGAGGASITILNSTPLGGAYCSLTDSSGAAPPLKLEPTIDAETSTALCLCAEGGTPPYTFQIHGSLPAGQTFNQDTGCVEGEPTAGAATGSGRTVGFGVVDADGETASIECEVHRGCPACPDDGDEGSFLY